MPWPSFEEKSVSVLEILSTLMGEFGEWGKRYEIEERVCQSLPQRPDFPFSASPNILLFLDSYTQVV